MKKILSSIFFLSILWSYAQQGRVGINTENPKATLHITDKTANDNGIIEKPHHKVGLKVPTHTILPKVPYDTPEQKNLSKEKNGMLIYTDIPVNGGDAEQGFYYWDNNSFSWENIVDSRETNIDISKTIVIGDRLKVALGRSNAQTEIVLNQTKSFDPEFIIDTNTNELIIAKSSEYYVLVAGSLLKKGGIAPFRLDVNTKSGGVKDNNKSFSAEVSTAADANGENRVANFYISKSLSLDKGDRVSLSVQATGDSSTSLDEVTIKTPFSITLIKLN